MTKKVLHSKRVLPRTSIDFIVFLFLKKSLANLYAVRAIPCGNGTLLPLLHTLCRLLFGRSGERREEEGW